MSFIQLISTGLLVSLIQKYYSFFKKNSTANSEGKVMLFAPVRVNHSMNLNRNMGNNNLKNL